MPAHLRLAAVLGLALCAGACRRDALEPVPSSIVVQPVQLDFGRVIVGQARALTVEVLNTGKVPLEGQWRLRGAGFLSDDSVPSRAVVGATLMTVRCAPEAEGPLDGVLTIALLGFQPLEVPLACEGVAAPACQPSGPCRTASYSPALGRCVEVDRADGEPCTAADACLVAAACRAGRCEGAARTCADGDPCTADTCHPERGCEHPPQLACPGAGPCQVGRCQPGTGCVVEPAVDGTPCGPRRGCAEADVCIAGACVVRDPPEGFECAPASPCAGPGRCQGDVCVRPTPSLLQPAFRFSQLEADGGPPEAWADLLAQRDGGLVVSSYFMSVPRLGVNSPNPIDLPQGAPRRCVIWHDWLVCGDYPGSAAAPVSAIELATGRTAWSYTAAAQQIPELVGPTVQFFTARLAVLSESELLALYESRTMTAEGVDPRCRSFAMVVLDRQGNGLRTHFLADPIFSVCDHPHSYGVAVDRDANVYLAFSPSGADNPATTLQGTTFFSFSPSLQLRWRVHEPGTSGGELSVAQGWLFQEYSRAARSTATGAELATLLQGFGRGVAGEGVAVAGEFGTDRLHAVDLSTGAPRWVWPLTGAIGRAPLQAARWASPWGERNVVLALSGGSPYRLEAYELATGAQAFSCPIALADAPGMLAVTPGGLSVMVGTAPVAAGWPTCDSCDPKFARTRNEFATFAVPGLSPADVPWAGAWGGEAHPHRERR